MLAMIRDGATHLGVATDHVVESFRNDMYAGYKTGEGIETVLWEQFHPLESALRTMGVTVWAMEEQEADDGLAAAAARAHADPRVTRVLICTPDKDLAQCVRGSDVIQFDRRKREIRDAEGVVEKFGVAPTSIPDYLALVGDTADGFPGVPKWGAKSASTILAHYEHIESIPEDEARWSVKVRGAAGLSRSLREHWIEAQLFKELATLRTDVPVFEDVEELRWRGPTDAFAETCSALGVPDLAKRASEVARSRIESSA
jgi:5'-3' exonuclease